MILHENIRQLGDPILRGKSEPFEADDYIGIQKTLNALIGMLDIVHQRYDFSWGSGMAAVQLGILKQACVIWLPESGYEQFINAQIVGQSKETNTAWEGCMSFFDKRGQVPRPNWIEVEYLDEKGVMKTERFEDKKARILHHEIDHTNGVLYTDHMDDPKDLMDIEAYKKLKQR